MTVKKIMNWMIAAILTICGGGVLTSCSNEDNPTNKQPEKYAGVPLIIHGADFGTDAWVGQMLERRYARSTSKNNQKSSLVREILITFAAYFKYSG